MHLQLKRLAILAAVALRASGSFTACAPITQYASQVSHVSDTSYPNGLDINYTNRGFASVANGGYALNSNGYDIVFASDSAGANLLSWDPLLPYSSTTGQIATHVAIALSPSQNTVFYVCAGNPAITTFQGGATGAAWSADYAAVYHLGTGAAISGADATANANSSTSTSGTVESFNGILGGAAYFLPNAYLSIPDSTSLNPANVSFAMWINPASTQNQFANPINKGSHSSAPFGRYYIQLNNNNASPFTGNQCVMGMSDTTTVTVALTINNTAPSGSGGNYTVWQHVACTYNATSGVLTGYVNGVSQGTATASGSKTLFTATTALTLGDTAAFTGNSYKAYIDEVHIWNTVRTADEIVTEYNNGAPMYNASPVAFFSVGAWSNSLYAFGTNTFPFFYNDQYTGANFWPSTFMCARGDTWYSAWASGGTQYISFNDGQGFSPSGGIGSGGGGCEQGSGFGANIGFATIDASLQAGTNVNCMTSAGYASQTNTGGWTDNATWKSTGVLAINDGATTTGTYWAVQRQLDSSPWTPSNASIMFSADGGVTWCAPGHTGGSCNTNGDAPAANTGEFNANFLLLAFLEYEQGATGALSVDCNPSYIYAYGGNSTYTSWILGRVARGTNLQTAANWTFYTGAVGGNPCSSGNWSSSSSGATTLLSFAGGGINFVPALIYISGYGYVLASNDQSNDVLFYSAATNTGPWKLQYFEPSAVNGGPYNFTQPMLASLQTVPNGYAVQVVTGGSYTRDTNNTSTPYSPYFRTLTITNGPNTWLLQ
jgi:Concanavalin A-like lectin/glucanases superfamily